MATDELQRSDQDLWVRGYIGYIKEIREARPASTIPCRPPDEWDCGGVARIYSMKMTSV